MKYDDVDWEQAACRGIGSDMFFIDDNNEARKHMPMIRRVCRDCPILSDCAEYSTWNEMFGVWGGMTSEERRLVRQRARRAA